MAEKLSNGAVRVGRLTKAHGLKGGLKIELYTDIPEQRFVPGACYSLQVPDESPWSGKTLELAELRWYNEHPVAFFVGVADRTAAESLARAILWIDEAAATSVVEDNAWYDHQLIGLRVLRDGVDIGSIASLEHLPAQDLLTITTETGDVLVPFVAAIVPEVNLEAGTVTVTPPAGLFEELPAEAESE